MCYFYLRYFLFKQLWKSIQKLLFFPDAMLIFYLLKSRNIWYLGLLVVVSLLVFQFVIHRVPSINKKQDNVYFRSFWNTVSYKSNKPNISYFSRRSFHSRTCIVVLITPNVLNVYKVQWILQNWLCNSTDYTSLIWSPLKPTWNIWKRAGTKWN